MARQKNRPLVLLVVFLHFVSFFLALCFVILYYITETHLIGAGKETAMLFRSKKAPPPLPPDREPAIRQSICTGEMTGGYIDGPDGRFHELRLLRDGAEKAAFCREMGVTPEQIRILY